MNSKLGSAVSALMITMFIAFMLSSAIENQPQETKIVMPEEISQAKQGDTLKVSRVTKDSVYIEFNNKANQ